MNNSITDPATDAIVGAAAKYGSELLAAAAPEGADPALRLARNLILRIRVSPQNSAEVLTAVDRVLEQCDDIERGEELRGALATAVSKDPDLASDIATMMSDTL